MVTGIEVPRTTTATSSTPSERVATIVARVSAALRATSAASDAARELAPEALEALVDAGIPRALLPAAYGGLELGPVDGVRLFEELATVDSAASWVGMISAAGAWLSILLPPRAADELFADPRSVVNGSLFPPLAAEVVPDGYRVSGRTAFASGCRAASWLGFQAVIMENGAPRIGPNGLPASLIVHLPASQATIIDHWDTLGMRGTGSHDVIVTDTFIPAHLAWEISPFAPANPAFTDGLSRMGIWWFSPLVASVALGTARAAVAGMIDLAQAKVPNYSQAPLADRSIVQEHLARARATVDAARHYLYGALAEADLAVAGGSKLDIEQGIPLALAGSYAVEAAITAVDLVHRCAGTSGIRAEHPFERHFRDVHTISQHAFVAAARFESVGKLLVGRESDWPFYYL